MNAGISPKARISISGRSCGDSEETEITVEVENGSAETMFLVTSEARLFCHVESGDASLILAKIYIQDEPIDLPAFARIDCGQSFEFESQFALQPGFRLVRVSIGYLDANGMSELLQMSQQVDAWRVAAFLEDHQIIVDAKIDYGASTQSE